MSDQDGSHVFFRGCHLSASGKGVLQRSQDMVCVGRVCDTHRERRERLAYRRYAATVRAQAERAMSGVGILSGHA